jgi:hypothetical protein
VLDDSYRRVVRSNEDAQMANSAARGQTPNIRIIQPPERPTGHSLARSIALAGCVVGLLAAAAAGLALNALRQVFVTSRDVVAALNLPVLVAVADRGTRKAMSAAPADRGATAPQTQQLA